MHVDALETLFDFNSAVSRPPRAPRSAADSVSALGEQATGISCCEADGQGHAASGRFAGALDLPLRRLPFRPGSCGTQIATTTSSWMLPRCQGTLNTQGGGTAARHPVQRAPAMWKRREEQRAHGPYQRILSVEEVGIYKRIRGSMGLPSTGWASGKRLNSCPQILDAWGRQITDGGSPGQSIRTTQGAPPSQQDLEINSLAYPPAPGVDA